MIPRLPLPWFLAALLVTSILTGEEKKIGVAWLGESREARETLHGFQEILGGLYAGIELEVQGELEVEQLDELLESWTRDKDALVILGDGAIEELERHTFPVPVFVCTTHRDAPPGTPLSTGVIGSPVPGPQFDIFEAVIENLEEMRVIVQEGGPGAERDLEITRELSTPRGIELDVRRVKTAGEAVEEARSTETDSPDAILLGSQPELLERARDVVEAAGEVPVLSYRAEAIRHGALIGFRARYRKLGMLLARQVMDHLLIAVPLADIPPVSDPLPSVIINVRQADRLEIHIPFEILEQADLE